MVEHLSEESLDFYLDQALVPGERAVVEAHLASCAHCQARLTALAELYGAFAALPPEPLPFDLTPHILARIAPRRWSIRGGRIEALLAAQAFLTALLACWIVTKSTEQVPLAWLRSQLDPLGLISDWGGWRMPQLPLAASLSATSFPLSLDPAQWSLIALVGLVLWAIANRALLGNLVTQTRQQERM